jgi:hypothetical protein
MEHQSNDALASRIVAKYMAGIVGEAELISLSRRPRLAKSHVDRMSPVLGTETGFAASI